MRNKGRLSLDEYLEMPYPFNVIAAEGGGYVVTFPDLPGCMTQVEDVEEIGRMAEDARRLWIEVEYEAGEEIPLPSYPQEYSGRFNVRMPRSLHKRLAEMAEGEGVSLNQLVISLLSAGEAGATRTRSRPPRVSRAKRRTARVK